MLKLEGAALAALVFATPWNAWGHVTLQTREAPAASYYKAVLNVGHGCEGSPTKEIRVKIPEGMQSAKPMPKPGWRIEIVRGAIAQPYDNHGRTVLEDVVELRWTGGSLPDDQYDEFAFRGKLPDRPEGTVLHVPVVQLCETGEHRWIEIPAEGQSPGDLREPAPSVRLTGKKQ